MPVQRASYVVYLAPISQGLLFSRDVVRLSYQLSPAKSRMPKSKAVSFLQSGSTQCTKNGSLPKAYWSGLKGSYRRWSEEGLTEVHVWRRRAKICCAPTMLFILYIVWQCLMMGDQ